MPEPPPKPKRSPDDLAEVERALSVLQGRHPEHERTRREDEAARAKRRAELEAQSRLATREVRKKQLKIGAVVVAVLAVGIVVGALFRSEAARRGTIEKAAAPYRAMGFVVAETSSRSSPGRLEAAPDAGCFVAASTDTSPIRVSWGPGQIEGPGPVVFCTCKGEALTVTSTVAAGGGLVLLRTDAARVGGSRAFAFLPFDARTTAYADEPCREASLEAWIDAKRSPPATPDEKWLEAEAGRAALARVGLKHLATVKAGKPFAVVDVPDGSCLLALADSPTATLGLQLKGKPPAINGAAGALAWCAPSTGPALVVREGGAGDVAVLVVPAARVGGAIGLREVLPPSVGPRVVATPDHGWSAKQLLLASAVPETLVGTANAPEIPADTDARIIAASFGTKGALTVEPAPDVFSFCEPPLDGESLATVCAFTGPQKWRAASADAVGGVARARLPFWLFGMQGVTEPAAMKAELELVTFARRLHHQGFEPTTIEAATELPNGVEVLGRAGEDAFVALGVGPVAPWLFPYAIDGVPWSITDEPAIVPIQTLARVTVTTKVKTLPPPDKRRSVVFRRQKK